MFCVHGTQSNVAIHECDCNMYVILVLSRFVVHMLPLCIVHFIEKSKLFFIFIRG